MLSKLLKFSKPLFSCLLNEDNSVIITIFVNKSEDFIGLYRYSM